MIIFYNPLEHMPHKIAAVEEGGEGPSHVRNNSCDHIHTDEVILARTSQVILTSQVPKNRHTLCELQVSIDVVGQLEQINLRYVYISCNYYII